MLVRIVKDVSEVWYGMCVCVSEVWRRCVRVSVMGRSGEGGVCVQPQTTMLATWRRTRFVAETLSRPLRRC